MASMEREVLEVDVLVVGAGPAGLACAIELARRAKLRAKELSILVLDKADEISDVVTAVRLAGSLPPSAAQRSIAS